MDWENLLTKSANVSKWLLLGYCIGCTLATLGAQPIFNVVLAGVASGVIVADWINQAQKAAE